MSAEAIGLFRPVSAPRALDEELSTTVSPRVEPALQRRRMWERRYARFVGMTDVGVVVAVTASAGGLSLLLSTSSATDASDAMRATLLMAPLWLVMLAVFHTRTTEIMGSGATEYKRVAQATLFAFGILAILLIAFEWQGARLQVFEALPLGLVALMGARWAWRRWLIHQREYGLYATRVIVGGNDDDIAYVIRTLEQSGKRGYVVVGAAPLSPRGDELVIDGRTYRVVGPMDRLAVHARELGADSVIVASRPDDDEDFIRRLSWDLEGTASELILSSPLADVAGPRISLRPIDGLPLIHVKIPEFEGGTHVLKRGMDILFSGLALIPLLVLTPIIALLIAFDDGGPVFFRQTRVGRDGREFAMLKFRTMRVDAEAQLVALRHQNEGAGPLFKLKQDPRVTRVGAVLRKYSIDEVPQFWNVLRGDMSVVGPRPPLPHEVRSYHGTVYRRLYIKPGITGLWQVSGRSDLSWDESVRLDLRYVENWSVLTDLMIMWRTARVMLRPEGAY